MSRQFQQQLALQSGARISLLNAPANFRNGLELPPTVKVIGIQKPLDCILFFPKSTEELSNKLAKLAEKLAPQGKLWVLWPLETAASDPELTLARVQAVGKEAGLLSGENCPVDETYIALGFSVTA